MTDPQPSGWAEFWRSVLEAIPVGAALWGALGGSTNAIVIRTSLHEAIRHVCLGALVAAGMGGLGAPILSHWLGIPAEALRVAEGAAGGAVAYLTGSIGAAILEVLIQRIRAGRLPNDQDP